VAPNTNVCPVCLGMPGSLPVINEKAIEYTIMTGLALNCEIQLHSVFARKNYFYPDLPKGYQISQYELPLCLNGYVDIEPDGGAPKRVRVRRAHLEEDTGKLTHVGSQSLVDLNRAGVPLLEIVTEADISSAEEAYAYVTRLRQVVRYLGVSTGDMEKGAMRCEANLSLTDPATGEWGTKVEIKNLNSFRSLRNAIEYEIKRQADVLTRGGTIKQVTMGWDENNQRTVLQRTKEGDTGYRYFPEPDLPPLHLDQTWVDEIANALPELPDKKFKRYISEFELTGKEAGVLAEDRAVAEYFDAAVAAAAQNGTDVSPKLISNWVTGQLFRKLGETDLSITDIQMLPDQLVELINLVTGKTINQSAAKKVFAVMFDTGRPPSEIVKEMGLQQISNADQLLPIAQKVLADNPDAVAQFQGGKEGIINFLVGQVMRATRGKANPHLAEQVIRKEMKLLQK
jgi:aspartyl-tRNA(Asn)/glutamyl-tRNA(Gln) amidotransferase subunit B